MGSLDTPLCCLGVSAILRTSLKNLPVIFKLVIFNTSCMPRKVNPALMRPYSVSEELQLVVGKGPMPRSAVVKKLWEYIKKNGLQDEKNKRMINADENLKVVFGGKKQVSMFEMTKLVSPHLKAV